MKGSEKGFNHSVFRKAVKTAAGLNDFVPVKIFDAIVLSGTQNEDKMTCYVRSVDSSINALEVRYNLCVSDGEVKVPLDESVVTIAMTAFTDPYIVNFTELISHQINVGDTVINLVNGELKIKQGDVVIELSNGKINIKNGSKDFKTLMDSFFDHIAAMTFTNGAGTTGVPNNVSDLNNDKSNFDELWQ